MGDCKRLRRLPLGGLRAVKSVWENVGKLDARRCSTGVSEWNASRCVDHPVILW